LSPSQGILNAKKAKNLKDLKDIRKAQESGDKKLTIHSPPKLLVDLPMPHRN
jgi:hypothetical protein